MRWTLGRRLAMVGVAVVIAAAALGVIGFLQASATGTQGARAIAATEGLAVVNDAQHAASVGLASAYALLTPLNDPARVTTVERAAEHADELRGQVAAIRDQRHLWTFDDAVAAFDASVTGVLAAADAMAASGGRLTPEQVDQTQAAWDSFDEHSDALKTQLSELAQAEAKAATDAVSDAQLLLLICGGLVVPIVAVSMWLLTRSITRPVRQTRQLLEQVVGGDFTRRLQLGRQDELGDMATALNTTVAQVGTALAAIASESAALTAASANLQAVSQQISGSASRLTDEARAASISVNQAGHETQTAAVATDSLRNAVVGIAADTDEAATIADEAVAIADSANRTIAKLDESSAQIGDVAAVIAAIADQTNLLALNATIEASRAGEMGKGFAVVATEVKELAKQTATATSDIGARIAAIQTDTGAAVTELERVTATIDRIAGIQRTIAASMQQQSAATQEIGDSVNRAAGNAGTVAARINGVTDASAEATDSAERTRLVAEELASTAARLGTVVAKFRIVGA